MLSPDTGREWVGAAWSCLKFGMPDLVALHTVEWMGDEEGGNGGVRERGWRGNWGWYVK